MATQSIHVTPENVVALAAMFRECADMLAPELDNLELDLRIPAPWMHDPVSTWAMAQFNLYFAFGEHTFATIFRAEHEQHQAMSEALVATAEAYGLTEELIAAGFVELAAK